MAENEESMCKRTDGKGWRCRLPAMESRGFCVKHHHQSRLRQQHQPVPDHLKLGRPSKSKVVPKIEEESTNSDLVGSNLAPQSGGSNEGEIDSSFDLGVWAFSSRRSSRKRKEALTGFLENGPDLQRKRRKKVVKEEKLIDEDLGKDLDEDNPIVKDLKYGRLEVPRPSPSSTQRKSGKKIGTPGVKVGGSCSKSVPIRPIRSKNAEPQPISTVKPFPIGNSSVKSATKNKKKCHWCRFSSYRVFVKCLTCKQFSFCVDCINQRYYDKAAVKRKCPVCLGTCQCRACAKLKPKEVKMKEPVVYNPELDVDNGEPDVDDCDPVVDDRELVIYDIEPVIPNRELVVYNREKKFDKMKQLHVVRMLIPLLEQINEEKIIELDIEAKNKGKTHYHLQVQLAIDSQKQQCRFCKSWVLDVHRSCGNCSYILCILCCQDFRDGFLQSGLEDLKNTRTVRSKSLTKLSWKFSADGNIRCPPGKLGGCGYGVLNLTSFTPFSLTKDLEASAKQIVCKYKFKKPFGVASSFCSLCEGNEEIGSEKVGNFNKNKDLYFLTKQDFQDKNLEHFIYHWGKGQPLIIRDVLKSQPQLNWDLGFMFCTHLKKSAESGKTKSRSDWCKVQFGREQIFSGGKTHQNAWEEFLKFKVRFSSGTFQDQFPNHYEAVMQALPFQEYANPFTGLLNLAANSLDEPQNPNLGPFVYLSYGGSEDLIQDEFLMKLSYHAYDMVNILAHATERRIPEQKLNEAKILMNKYSSQDHMKSWKKIRTRNKLEELFGNSSGLEHDTIGGVRVNGELHILTDDSSSEDEESCKYEVGSSSRYAEEQVVDTCGAQWDIFRRQDVPKLVEYLRKHSNYLSKSNGSPKKVFHPIFDEVYFLETSDKEKLKEEFNVEPLSFEQNIGEAVIVPAGCPYQIKKTKSCVNVVFEFVSPESVSECVKLNDEVRQLPVNHRAKGKMLEVKKMAVNGVEASIKEIRKVLQAEI